MNNILAACIITLVKSLDMTHKLSFPSFSPKSRSLVYHVYIQKILQKGTRVLNFMDPGFVY